MRISTLRKAFAIILLLSVGLTGVRWVRVIDPQRPAVLTTGLPVCDYRFFISKCIQEEKPYDPVTINYRDACYPQIAYLLVKWFPLSDRGENAYVWALFLGLVAGWALLVREKFGTERLWYFLPVLGTGFFLAGPLRGNPSAWAAGAVFAFLAWYDSSVKWKRYAAAIVLGFSASLKITPALFGLVYLRGRLMQPKSWPLNEIVVAALSCLILLVIPFYFFGGIDAIAPWFLNALENAKHYGSLSTVGFVELFNHRYLHNDVLPLPISMLLTKLFTALTLLAALFTANRYRLASLLGNAMLLLGHHEYAFVFLLPAFMLWFAQKETASRPLVDVLEGLCWFVVLCPLMNTFSAIVVMSYEMLRAFAALLLAFISLYAVAREIRHQIRLVEPIAS